MQGIDEPTLQLLQVVLLRDDEQLHDGLDGVADRLAEGEGTVGIKLEVSHLAATPVGMTVRCESELAEIDGRKLTFCVEVSDDRGKIGEGIHERFIVGNERFLKKAEARRDDI